MMQQPGHIPELVQDELLVANLTEAYATSWFVVKGTNEVAQSRLGVSPGDQLADLMYNINVRSILVQMT